MKAIVHLAGFPKGGKQQCMLCHSVIARKQYWPTMAMVLSTRGGMRVVYETDLVAGWRACGKEVQK